MILNYKHEEISCEPSDCCIGLNTAVDFNLISVYMLNVFLVCIFMMLNYAFKVTDTITAIPVTFKLDCR